METVDAVEVTLSEQDRPIPYSILLSEFQKTPPENPQKNPGLERVNRENFMGTFITTFAISIGDPGAQLNILHWMEVNQGFNHEETLKNFLQAGGSTCLSLQEKTMFFDAFRRVRNHENIATEEGWSFDDEEILSSLETFATDLSDPQSGTIKEYDMYFTKAELRGMAFDEFKKRLHEKIRQDTTSRTVNTE